MPIAEATIYEWQHANKTQKLAAEERFGFSRSLGWMARTLTDKKESPFL